MRQQLARSRPIIVKIVIGQQVYETVPALQSKKSIPEWNNEVFQFIVPVFMSQGTVEVIEKNMASGSDLILGEMKVDLNFLLQVQSIQTYFEPIMLD